MEVNSPRSNYLENCEQWLEYYRKLCPWASESIPLWRKAFNRGALMLPDTRGKWQWNVDLQCSDWISFRNNEESGDDSSK